MLYLNPCQSFVEHIPDWSCLWLARMLGIIDISIAKIPTPKSVLSNKNIEVRKPDGHLYGGFRSGKKTDKLILGARFAAEGGLLFVVY